jgi:hypothetical protein
LPTISFNGLATDISDRGIVGIPLKVNIDSGGSRTAFRSEGEQQSERSDAGMVIVE